MYFFLHLYSDQEKLVLVNIYLAHILTTRPSRELAKSQTQDKQQNPRGMSLLLVSTSESGVKHQSKSKLKNLIVL